MRRFNYKQTSHDHKPLADESLGKQEDEGGGEVEGGRKPGNSGGGMWKQGGGRWGQIGVVKTKLGMVVCSGGEKGRTKRRRLRTGRMYAGPRLNPGGGERILRNGQ